MFDTRPLSLALEALHTNRDRLLTALLKLNATKVDIDYEGGGDSGDVSGVAITPDSLMPQLHSETMGLCRVVRHYEEGDVRHELMDDVAQSLESALKDFTFSWLEIQHGGWENNDGARGTVTINVPENRFDLEHESYYTESCHYADSL